MNKFVNVYLYSEEEDDGTLIPIQYTLTEEQLEELLQAVKRSQKMIPFGDFFHETEDVLKFFILPSNERPFTKFDN